MMQVREREREKLWSLQKNNNVGGGRKAERERDSAALQAPSFHLKLS